MFHRLFLATCFLLVLGGMAFMVAFSLNALPPQVYTFVYTLVSSVDAPTSKYPHLTKFEGRWDVTLTPANQSQITQCETNVGVLTIRDGQVSGSVGALQKNITIRATVRDDGALIGKTFRGKEGEGPITGSIYKAKGSGEWSDILDCRGTFTMKKIDPVRDPVKGTLVSYTSEVALVRAGELRFPTPGQSLYVGDRIEVSSTGTAHLSIGQEQVQLTGGMQYTVGAAK